MAAAFPLTNTNLFEKSGLVVLVALITLIALVVVGLTDVILVVLVVDFVDVDRDAAIRGAADALTDRGYGYARCRTDGRRGEAACIAPDRTLSIGEAYTRAEKWQGGQNANDSDRSRRRFVGAGD